MYQDQPPPVNRYSKPVDNYNSSPYPPNQPYYDNNPMPPFNNGPPPVDRNSRMLQPDPQFYQQPNLMPNHTPVGGPPPVNRASRVLSTPPPSQYMHGGADQYNAYQPPPQYPPQVPMHNGGSAYPPQPTPMPPMPAHQYNNHMPPPQYQSQPVMNQHMPPHPNIPPQTMPPTNNYSAAPPQINVSPVSDINPQYVPVMLPVQQQPPRPMSVPAPMTNEATQQHVPQIVVPGQQMNNMLAPNPAAPKRRNTVDPSAMPAIDNLNLSPRNFDQPSAPTKKPLPKIPLTKSNGPKGNPKAASAPTTPSIQSPVEEKPMQPTQPVPKQPAAMKVPPGNAKPKSTLVMRVPKQAPPPMPPSDPSPPPRPEVPPMVPDKPEPVVEDTPPPRPSTSPRAQVPVYEDPLPALPKSALPQNMTEGRDYKYYESGESLIVKKAMRGWKYREEARRKVKLGKNQIVLFVGDANCGKTAAIKAKLGSFPTEYKPSAFDMTKIKLDGNEVELWDIGDNPDMVSKLNLCFPVACCVVIVFALDNEESFRNVKLKWVPWAREKNPQAPILLLGTKLDLMTPEARSLHQPEHTERCQYAEKIDGCYVEGSAKTMEGFGEMFDIILTMLYSLAKKKPAKK